MRLFSSLYDKAMRWAAHRHAQWYLMSLSFAESSFFPVPPDVMLAPMALANTRKAWRYAAITTVSSVVGGMAGYLIGYFAFELVEPWVQSTGYGEKYLQTAAWFKEWGVWVIFIAGFSPIPYKIFTISAGVASMAFLPFILASLIGRGARFFLVATVMVWGGQRMEQVLRRYVDVLGWLLVVLIIAGVIFYR